MQGWDKISGRIEKQLSGHDRDAWNAMNENDLVGMWAHYTKADIESHRDDDIDGVRDTLLEIPDQLRAEVTLKFAQIVSDWDEQLDAASGDPDAARDDQGEVDELALAQQVMVDDITREGVLFQYCLLYTSPSPRDRQKSRMPSSA